MTTFNATAARALVTEATSLHGCYLRYETEQLLDAIQAAATCGQSELYVDYSSPIIVARLKALDFCVCEVSSQRDGNSMTISW